MSCRLASRKEIAVTYTQPVFIEKDENQTFKATMLGWPGVAASASTREEALSRLRQILQRRLASGEIVNLDVEVPQSEHPWLKHAGLFADNPMFDEVLKEIEAYRRELDSETDET